jgi:hypothetical protein
MENIFKENDRVFHISHGWGNVISPSDRSVGVKFDNEEKLFYILGLNLLSFTEYSLWNYSQERPQIIPEVGQVVWVRDEDDDEWVVTHFVQMDGAYYCTYDGNPFLKVYNTWRYLTTKNPYLNEN